MAVIDTQATFAFNFTRTAAGLFSDVYDTRNGGIGVGRKVVYFAVNVRARDVADSDENYWLNLKSHNTLSSGNLATGNIQLFSLNLAPAFVEAGQWYYIVVPPWHRRYLQVDSGVGGTTPSITFDAYLTNSEPRWYKNQPFIAL